MSKLKGSRLEAEVDRARTDANWKRLAELLPSIRSKNSGLEEMYDLVQAEIQLESYLEQQGEVLRPQKDHYEKLKASENHLYAVLREKGSNASLVLEAHLLLAKLHYVSVEFRKALVDIENSGMEHGSTPFRTLRVLRLIAEGYAIKGMCLEGLETPARSHSGSLVSNSSTISNSDQKALFCFEKSAELAISYINELEKSISSAGPKQTVNSSSGSLMNTSNRPKEKIGEILECCLERVAVLRAKDTVAQKKNGGEGIEWYRRIITCLGDKTTGERLQQKLSRQLAELLLRAAVPSEKAISEALSTKSLNLSFYTGSQRGYFSPSSRIEEIILLLLISEVLATREVVLSRSDDSSPSRQHSLRNAKAAYNLLTLVLSTLRQYSLLASIYERAMKFANQDSFLWQQFALASVCRGRWLRAVRLLEQSIDTTPVTNGTSESGLSTVAECMLLAQLHIERFGDFENALKYSQKSIDLCKKDGKLEFLRPRCSLLYAIAHGQKSHCQKLWKEKKEGLSVTIRLLEEAVSADPHDYLAVYYASLYHAFSRDLEAARERCSRSLELNSEQPAAVMLLALIFTAYGDLKGALELISNALIDFENNYGLLVLRLHIESKFGRIEESLNTCSHLLEFWKKRDATSTTFLSGEEDRSQNGIDSLPTFFKEGSVKGTPSLGRELSTPLLNTSTPILAFPNGSSVLEMSMVDGGKTVSDGQSTASDSNGAGSGGAQDSEAWAKFRAQADIWTSLAELFLAEGKVSDVARCVEQAVQLFPFSSQALYLKGRLLTVRAEKLEDEAMADKLRGEAKAALLSALALSPGHELSMRHLAALYASENNLDMAEHMLRELIRSDPLNCDNWQQLGCILMRQNHAEQATECLTAAAKLDRSTPLLPFSMIPLVFPTSF